jgi:tetratricopeptide (TPR) repeat protein
LPNPEKLVKERRFFDAAKIYHERAVQERDDHKKRRFLNFAARYYESAGEFSLAMKCFLESKDLDRALASAVKAKNGKILSNALIEAGYKQEEIVRLLLKCGLRLVEAREFAEAHTFAGEAYGLGHSAIAEALLTFIDGCVQSSPERVIASIKALQIPSESDSLAREISFVANKFLTSMPKVSGSAKEIPTHCPECGAPLSAKRKGKVIECEYCGYPVRLD